MEKVISKRADFVVDALFYFEHMDDMYSLGVPVTSQARDSCSNKKSYLFLR